MDAVLFDLVEEEGRLVDHFTGIGLWWVAEDREGETESERDNKSGKDVARIQDRSS
jgi:hypothetical protein